MTDFFRLLDRLVVDSVVIVDRGKGRAHPRIPKAIYPVDYGHLTNTLAVDGAEIDVFIGSAAGRGVVGVALTVDLQKRDSEIKILLNCTPSEIQDVRRFCSEVLGI